MALSRFTQWLWPGGAAARVAATHEHPSAGLTSSSFPDFPSGFREPDTVTFYTDEDFTQPVSGGDSGNVSGGGAKDFSFTAPSSGDALYYRCEIHPTQMQGELSLQ